MNLSMMNLHVPLFLAMLLTVASAQDTTFRGSNVVDLGAPYSESGRTLGTNDTTEKKAKPKKKNHNKPKKSRKPKKSMKPKKKMEKKKTHSPTGAPTSAPTGVPTETPTTAYPTFMTTYHPTYGHSTSSSTWTYWPTEYPTTTVSPTTTPRPSPVPTPRPTRSPNWVRPSYGPAVCERWYNGSIGGDDDYEELFRDCGARPTRAPAPSPPPTRWPTRVPTPPIPRPTLSPLGFGNGYPCCGELDDDQDYCRLCFDDNGDRIYDGTSAPANRHPFYRKPSSPSQRPTPRFRVDDD